MNMLLPSPVFLWSPRGVFLCLIVCLLLAAASRPLAASSTVELVGDPWPPYVTGSLGEYADGGVAVKIIERVFAEIDGAEVQFPLIPWKRALLEVERGSRDGIPALLKTPEREAYMDYTAPLVTGQNLVWSVADDGAAFEWTSIDDLKGRKVGVVTGYSNGDRMDQAIAAGQINAIEAPNVRQLFLMLEAGRVELALANDAVGYELAKKHRRVAIKPARRALNSETFYIGISKKSDAVELIPAINAAMERLRRDGVIDRIVRGED